MRKWVIAPLLLTALLLGGWLIQAKRAETGCSGCCTSPADCPTPACCLRP